MTDSTAGRGLKFRLGLMMFLQIFIWGAWYELNFGYVGSGLGFSSDQQWYTFSAFNFGAIFALFFGTQFADRRFAAEKFLAFSHLIGGLAIGALFFVEKGWSTKFGEVEINLTFWVFFLLMLIHSLLYVPTISITNSIAFAHLKDPQNEFGRIRVWGTIGWIVASWPMIFILVNWSKVPAFGTIPVFEWLGEALKAENARVGDDSRHTTRYIYLIAGVASLLMAALSLRLPHTPPKAVVSGSDKFAWLEAVKLLRKPFILVLFVVTLLDAAIHQAFFYFTADFLVSDVVKIPSNWASPVMKIGQIAEILTMIVLGYVLKSLGWRWTMIIGVLGHGARFAVFAYYPEQWAAIAINVVHGICYAFFFATVYIFIDEFFPKDARSSAQGLFNFLIIGAGPMIANYVCGLLKKRYEIGDKVYDYQKIFEWPLLASAIGAGLLLVLFHPPKKNTE